MKRVLIYGWAALMMLPFFTSEAPAAGKVTVSNASELHQAVEAANQGKIKEIGLRDGTYSLDSGLWVSGDNITIYGVSGNRAAVVIKGQGMSGSVSHVFWAAGRGFTLKNLSLGLVANHGVQVHGERDADNFSMENVRIFDCGEQLLKVSYDEANTRNGADRGRVVGCLFEYTAGVGPQYYIGGVDAHNARGWVIQGNTFRGIRSPSDEVAEFAVHFWSNSKDTLVEGNRIVNCDRGIGLGLGDRGHQGGIVRNNMIFHDRISGFGDVGIALESCSGAKVYNNTIVQLHDYPNAIEYRFPATHNVLIANNLTNRGIVSRDGGQAEVKNNYQSADPAWFMNPKAGDLRLKTAPGEVIDRGAAVKGLTVDFMGQKRPKGRAVDIGAHELR